MLSEQSASKVVRQAYGRAFGRTRELEEIPPTDTHIKYKTRFGGFYFLFGGASLRQSGRNHCCRKNKII
ncbi:MAG: hypothetical protein A3C64_01605 [Candidatus Yanofskybacteria bacterium RIFCSPHIGHO2_02_FULL_41_12]|nr:MAG: hypothetical protein A3C64_01605 [Candidatus Yanofskybacteria bacterium RIFCSPHIGHO2_02_FULL_41_12]